MPEDDKLICPSYDTAVELATLQWKRVEDAEKYAKFCREQIDSLKKEHAETIEQMEMKHAQEIQALKTQAILPKEKTSL